MDHRASDAVRAAQKPRRKGDVTREKRVADASRAHHLALELDRRRDDDLEPRA